MSKPPATTTCEDHGIHTWQGDVVCTACGFVYVAPEGKMLVLPDNCTNCRARLLPPGKWSGRMACHQCAIAQSK